MDATTIKCRALMVGDWCCNKHGFPMQITNVGDDYAYATFEGNEGDPWEFDDKDDQPQPIVLTPEILEKNGFKKIDFSHYQINDRTLVLDADGKWDGEVSWHWVVTEMSTNSKGQNVVLDYYVATLNYAHQLQHALRLCGLNELADNFKV